MLTKIENAPDYNTVMQARTTIQNDQKATTTTVQTVDEQRLVAWKKEGKPWDWIFKKFPGRTHPAIRTRWSMVRPRSE
jgi:hypothetical protein